MAIDWIARAMAMAGGSAKSVVCTDAASTPEGIRWNTGDGEVIGTLSAEDAKGGFYMVPSSTEGAEEEGRFERSLNGGPIIYMVENGSWAKVTTTEVDIREQAVRYLLSASGEEYT